MLKNWTAVALVLCYCFMQGSYYGLGITYPAGISMLADLTVVAIIYCKQPVCDLMPYTTWQAQLVACWLERSLWDRLIIALFPVGWVFYAFAGDPWWPLYFISLAQFVAAGFEAFENFQSARSAKAGSANKQDGDKPPNAEFAVAGGGYG